MKVNYVTALCIISCAFFSSRLFAQTLNTGVVPMAATVNLSDDAIVDYMPSLLHLDHHPIPATGEYSTAKQEVMAKRAAWEAAHPNPELTQRKTRSVAAKPYQIKGVFANNASGIPNDNDIAISNDGKVLAAVNGSIRILNDTLKSLLTKSIVSIFNPIVGNVWNSDPRVLYDPIADRFILLCFTGALSTDNQILIAFSQTSDPAGAWNLYKLNGAPFNDSTWSDYPIIAIDKKELFVTFNLVKDNIGWQNGFKQSVIWQFNKQKGYDGDTLSYKLWSDIKYNGVNLRNICPAKYHDPDLGEGMYFLSVKNVAAANDTLFLLHIKDTLPAANAQLDIRVLKTPVTYGFPPNARQKKPSPTSNLYLMTNDARILAAVYENDRVYFGSNTLNPQFMNAGVMLGYVDAVSSATPTVDAKIFSTATTEYGYPSMAWMGKGPGNHRMLFNVSHCYTDSFCGTSILYRNELGEYSDFVPIYEGNSYIATLQDSNQRWGDYTNIQPRYNKWSEAYLGNSGARNFGACHWVARIGCDSTYLASLENDAPKDIDVTLYPNPTVNRISVQFTAEKSITTDFVIVDAAGKMVAKVLTAKPKIGLNEFSFSTENLAAGNYQLVISADGQGALLSKQFVKQ